MVVNQGPQSGDGAGGGGTVRHFFLLELFIILLILGGTCPLLCGSFGIFENVTKMLINFANELGTKCYND